MYEKKGDNLISKMFFKKIGTCKILKVKFPIDNNSRKLGETHFYFTLNELKLKNAKLLKKDILNYRLKGGEKEWQKH